jgi:hypothetical protein
LNISYTTYNAPKNNKFSPATFAAGTTPSSGGGLGAAMVAGMSAGWLSRKLNSQKTQAQATYYDFRQYGPYTDSFNGKNFLFGANEDQLLLSNNSDESDAKIGKFAHSYDFFVRNSCLKRCLKWAKNAVDTIRHYNTPEEKMLGLTTETQKAHAYLRAALLPLNSEGAML